MVLSAFAFGRAAAALAFSVMDFFKSCIVWLFACIFRLYSYQASEVSATVFLRFLSSSFCFLRLEIWDCRFLFMA